MTKEKRGSQLKITFHINFMNDKYPDLIKKSTFEEVKDGKWTKWLIMNNIRMNRKITANN